MLRVSLIVCAGVLAIGACGATGGAGTRKLRIATAGSGNGVVTVTPRGLRCDSRDSAARDCEPDLAAGSVVALSAIPDGESAFVGWSGASCQGPGMCVVTLDQAATVEARFESRPGARGWVARLGRQVDVFATAVAADRDDVYVTGSFSGDAVFDRPMASEGSSDVFVARFSRTRNQWEWAARIGGPGKEDAYGVAVSDDGRTVAVSGSFNDEVDFAGKHRSTGEFDGFVAVFQQKDGTLQPTAWLEQGGPHHESFGAVAVVKATRGGKPVQRVVAAGTLDDRETIIGAAEDGKWIWGPCSLKSESGMFNFNLGLAAASNGAAVLLTTVRDGAPPLSWTGCDKSDTAEIAGVSGADLVMASFDTATGKATWKVSISGDGDDAAGGVSVGPGGEIAILRSVTTQGADNQAAPTAILSVYKDGGTLLWERALGLGESFVPGQAAIVGDKVYASANLIDGSAHRNKAAVLLSVWPLAAGAERPLRDARISATQEGVLATGLAVSPSGAPFVAGVYAGEMTAGDERIPSLGTYNLMAVAVSPNFSVTWAHQPQGAGTQGANAIAALDDGRLVAAGTFTGRFGQGRDVAQSAGGYDAVVQLVERDGRPSGAPVIFGSTDYDSAFDVAPWGKGFVVGGQTGSDGLLGWVADPTAPPPKVDEARIGATRGGVVEGLAPTADGGMWVAGSYTGKVKAIPKLPESAERRGFVARFKAPGTPIWQAALGQDGESEVRAVAAIGDQVIVSGSFTGSICEGGERKKSAGGRDAFVAMGGEEGWRCWSWGDDKGDDVAKALSVDAAGRIAVGIESREAMDNGPHVVSLAESKVDRARVVVLDASLKEELVRDLPVECGRSMAGVQLVDRGVEALTHGQRESDFRSCSRIIKLRPHGAHLWSRVFQIEGGGSLTASGKTPGITLYGMAQAGGRLLLAGDLAGTLALPFGRQAGSADGDFVIMSLQDGDGEVQP